MSKYLLEIIENICEVEKVHYKKIGKVFRKYFENTNNNLPDRCVDGRGCNKDNYLGSQFPGGSLGLLDILKILLKCSENKAREILLNTYNSNLLVLGAHIDNNNGKMLDEELRIRVDGCGNQKLIKDSKILSHNTNNSNIIESRINWVKRNKGEIFVLLDAHKEIFPIINIHSRKTFDSIKALKENVSAFSCDLGSSIQRSSYIYECMMNNYLFRTTLTKRDFTTKFIQILLRDYIQTIKILKNMETFYIYI